jgi:hypothetical protein
MSLNRNSISLAIPCCAQDKKQLKRYISGDNQQSTNGFSLKRGRSLSVSNMNMSSDDKSKTKSHVHSSTSSYSQTFSIFMSKIEFMDEKDYTKTVQSLNQNYNEIHYHFTEMLNIPFIVKKMFTPRIRKEQKLHIHILNLDKPLQININDQTSPPNNKTMKITPSTKNINSITTPITSTRMLTPQLTPVHKEMPTFHL